VNADSPIHQQITKNCPTILTSSRAIFVGTSVNVKKRTIAREKDMTLITSRSTLFALLFILHCSVSFAFVQEDSPSDAPGDVTSAQSASDQTTKPASEAGFREEVQRVEQLACGLQGGLKAYHEHLQAAMQKQGYGPYHPLFRTHINGFEMDQIDLEDADEYKRGSFALSLRSSGQMLDPDPFGDWMAVQNWLDSFEATMNKARIMMARADIVVAHSTENIPPEVFRQLQKRWRAVADQAAEAYDHAMAARAVLYADGETVPAPQSCRFLRGGGRYAVICAFGVCRPQPAGGTDETGNAPVQHY
jgi:hypothetical protein